MFSAHHPCGVSVFCDSDWRMLNANLGAVPPVDLLPLNTYTIVSAYGRGDLFWITIGFVAMCVSVFGLKRSIDHVRYR